MPLLKAYVLCHWQISQRTHTLVLGIRRQDINDKHYFMFPNLFFFSLLRKNHHLRCGLFQQSTGLGGVLMVFREKKSLLIKVQKNCKNKQRSNRSSHHLLICKLRFRHINGRVPLKLSMAQLIWLPQPDHLFPWRLWHFLLTKRFLVVMSRREKPCSLSASSTRVAVG